MSEKGREQPSEPGTKRMIDLYHLTSDYVRLAEIAALFAYPNEFYAFSATTRWA